MSDILEPYMSNSNPTLEHHGILGMHWGHRKDKSSKLADDYSNEQYNRDKIIYGNGGAKRINKTISKGSNVSMARSKEKTHRDHVISKNKYFRQGGKVTVGIAGAVGTYAGLSIGSNLINSSKGQAVISKLLGRNAAQVTRTATTLLNDPLVKGIVSAGAASTASLLGGDIAVSAHMRVHGLDPNRMYS